MRSPTSDRLLGWLDPRVEEMAELLERLARSESPSTEPRSQEGIRRILTLELTGLDYLVRRVCDGSSVGDHLYARPRRRRRGEPRQLLIGHMDTVWPVGTLAEMPVRRDNGVLYGPGTHDMKGGLVEIVFALRALQELGLRPPATPVVLLNSDEEIGSPGSTRMISLLAKGAERAFVLEAGEGSVGKLKIARKGIGRFTITIHGRPAHAGSDPEHGVSAILELSHQVQQLFALNDPARGISVNVGTIDGGLRPNVIAPTAQAVIDVRVPSAAAGRELEQALRELKPELDGVTLHVEGGLERPPMEPLPRNRALLASAIRAGSLLGLDLDDAGLVGGASDANTASLFTGTLDGLGPIGDGSHAADEHVDLGRLPERAALLALLLLEPVDRPQTEPRRRWAGARSRPAFGAAIFGTTASRTNEALASAWRALGVEIVLIDAQAISRGWKPGETVIGRLDVLPTLDGVEPGLFELWRLEQHGVRVLNPARALVRAHDKLLTARLLARAGLPHPRTEHIPPHGHELPQLEPPVVIKPRFGSWGVDVFGCATARELRRCLDEVRSRPWFRRHGALIQELVPPVGYDLRILVAGDTVVGAIQRLSATGEWRTNISLGGTRKPAAPPAAASALAIAAAAASGADLIGVDLLPTADHYTILELNGSVDFNATYSLPGRDVYRDTAVALGLPILSSSRLTEPDRAELAS